MSLGDQMERLLQKHVAPDRQSFIRETFVPAALGRNPPQDGAVRRPAPRHGGSAACQLLARLADGRMGKPRPGAHHGDAEAGGPVGDDSARVPVGKLAGYLYQTHLGLNLSSIVVNLTQPLDAGRHDRQLQVRVMRAYKAAFMEMGEYAKERAGWVRSSPRSSGPSSSEALPVRGSATEGKNLLGIGPDFFDMIDEQAGPVGRQVRQDRPAHDEGVREERVAQQERFSTPQGRVQGRG